jgi:HD-GYP domain-containing protein (c-di-GMP phosphodiesterase class II)
MLGELPFPKHLKNVPEYAGGHHERMDGKGYPLGLTREQLSIPARMMGIADIFEALTSSDRPYKKGKKLSECLRILGFMKKDGHIDPDIFDVFIKEKVYMRYAEEYLPKEQIDEIDESKIPGYEV